MNIQNSTKLEYVDYWKIYKRIMENVCGKQVIVKEIGINCESLFDLRDNYHTEAKYRNKRRKNIKNHAKGVLVC